MKFFRINPETNEPELIEEFYTIKPFNEIIRRRKSYPGDNDGRKKILNKKEFTFIYMSSHYDSNTRYMKDEDRVEKLKALLDLPDDWKPDEFIEEAIKICLSEQESKSAPLYRSALASANALKAYYDDFTTRVTANPSSFKVDQILDYQKGMNQLDETFEKIRTLGEKVAAEVETIRSRKGRLISKFEGINGED